MKFKHAAAKALAYSLVRADAIPVDSSSRSSASHRRGWNKKGQKAQESPIKNSYWSKSRLGLVETVKILPVDYFFCIFTVDEKNAELLQMTAAVVAQSKRCLKS